ncbi:hypothetical protein GA252_05495 [Staphylococcus pseudintermedius]|nr:hypothetical protein [Staphylococcus pseudintermedius]
MVEAIISTLVVVVVGLIALFFILFMVVIESDYNPSNKRQSKSKLEKQLIKEIKHIEKEINERERLEKLYTKRDILLKQLKEDE